jgi:APA family basic amino acid/polyamine antiporter
MDPGLTAALAVGMASYAAYIIPLSSTGAKAVAVGAVLLIATANIIGVRPGAALLRWLTAIKIGSLLFIVVWALVGGSGSWSNFLPLSTPRAGSAPIAAALAGGLVAGFFSFGGWWDLTKVAGEVRDPTRTVPRAIALGVVAVTLLYLLTSASFIYLVPIENVASGETFASQAGEALFRGAGARVFSLVVVVSVLGSLTAVIMTAPRVYYAMAADGLFFRGAASLHPRFGTPARAIALQALLASVLVVLGSFQQIISYFIFVTVIFIGLTVAGVFVLRRKGGAAYNAPGYPLTPGFFLILVVVLLALLGGNNPVEAMLGAAIVALGWPVYVLLKRRRGDSGIQ